jgi:hypothetical protein
MKYDDAEIYFLNFETDALENEAGATHIGMYMAWMILHELVSEHLREETRAAADAVKARAISGASYVVDQLDCKLLDSDLSPLGNAFTAAYYNTAYMNDYGRCFGVSEGSTDDFCSVPDTWENFDKIARVLDLRFAAWKAVR